jgi:hypothetical protein
LRPPCEMTSKYSIKSTTYEQNSNMAALSSVHCHMPTGLDDDRPFCLLGSTRNDEGPELLPHRWQPGASR